MAAVLAAAVVRGLVAYQAEVAVDLDVVVEAFSLEGDHALGDVLVPVDGADVAAVETANPNQVVVASDCQAGAFLVHQVAEAFSFHREDEASLVEVGPYQEETHHQTDPHFGEVAQVSYQWGTQEEEAASFQAEAVASTLLLQLNQKQ